MKNLTVGLGAQAPSTREVVNDKHSQLNATFVKTRVAPCNLGELAAVIKQACLNEEPVSICGGRHAMGGQQFLQEGLLVDTSKLKDVINFDREAGLLTVQAGITWPELIKSLRNAPIGSHRNWTIAQKQTGCDELSVGGALSANVHGRGLTMPPLVNDVEEFTIVLHDGTSVKCSREQNSELFRLAIGGYGLFGVISSATLRLTPRTVLQRKVELADSIDVVENLETQAVHGARYGDFQFAIDDASPDFLKTGILSTYTPVGEARELQNDNRLLSVDAWRELVYLAHVDKSAAFQRYAKHYLATDGQLYQSDTFQLSTYLDDYHKEIDARTPQLPECHGTELISELYVPRHALSSFLQMAADALREHKASVIYGTVRLIEKDSETFLPWAKESWACIVFNIHVEHCSRGIENARRAFSALIDAALLFGGSYYLTYHRFASGEQMSQCYPQMSEFLQLKEKYDPFCRFRSNWFDYCRQITSC